MKKLNKKGYLTIEIILGATIAFVIAFFLIEITTKMVSDTEDTYRDTVVTTDGALITSGIKDAIESHETGIKKIEENSYYEKYTITYEDGNQGVIELSYDYSKKRYTVSYYEGSIVYYKKELDSSLSRCYIVIEVYDTNGKVTDLSNLVDKNIYIEIGGRNYFTDKLYSFIIPIDNLKKDDVCNIPSVGGSVRLVDYIKDLYSRGEKKIVTNNGVEYNTVECLGLINDRLGGTTTDYDAGNIRYYGANPNNYIYFNCDDYNNQTDSTCEKWRIIGVFDDKVKIMRNSSIGSYSFDNSNDLPLGTGSSNWTTSRLMKMLNAVSGTAGLGDGLYWNRQKGTCYTTTNFQIEFANQTTTCDMSTVGLKNDTTRSKISEATYYLRGEDDEVGGSLFANQMYQVERTTGRVYSGRPTTWVGKVALPYPSDYAYAVDFNKSTGGLSSYGNSGVIRYNWMRQILIGSTKLDGEYQAWLLTPNPNNGEGMWFVWEGGRIWLPDLYPCSDAAVVPTLYLDTWTGIYDGNGSSDNPYKMPTPQ